MKFQLFKKIYNNTYNTTMGFIHDGIIPKFKNQEEAYFYDQFKQYLQTEDLLFCYQMVEEGFKATSFQKKKMQEMLVIKCENNEYKYKDIQKIKDIDLKTKMKVLIHCTPRLYLSVESFHQNNTYAETDTDKMVKEFFDNHLHKEMFLKYFNKTFKDLKAYYYAGLDSSKDFYRYNNASIEKVRSHYEKILVVTSVLFKYEILKPQEVNNLKETLKSVSDFMKKTTSRAYSSSSFCKIGKENIDNFSEFLSETQKKLLSKDNKKDVLLKQLKSYNARNKSLTEEIKDLINQEEYSLDNLPLKAQEKINSINKISQELNDKEITDFLNERLPSILKKYFSIDEEYRTTLKNVEGYHAQELMLQSLTNIEKVILAKKEDNNYDLVTELSVENRKLKLKAV